MLFSEVMNNIEVKNGEAIVDVNADWMQGRAIFGGLQTAIALKVMRGLVPEVPIRSLQTTFIAPPSSNHIEAKAIILRQGKSATHVEAKLMDGDNVLAIVIGVFGMGRTSQVERVPEMAPVKCEKPRNYRYFPGKSPTFLQFFSARWLQGGMPFSAKADPNLVVEVDMPGENQSSEYHVVAVADFIPPIALSYLSAPCQGSSLTWMLEFLTDEITDMPVSGWRVDAEMVAGADGYTNQSVMLWGPGGKPMALSRQTMVVFG